MRLTKLLLASLALLAVLAAGLVTALLLLDLGIFRGQIEARASIAFDRRVAIGGSVHLEPSLRPLLVAEDVRIGNPDWASRADFAHIQRLEVRVALLPLLLGDLEVLDVVFAGADVLLEVGADDRNNFTFGRRTGPPELPDMHRFSVRESVLAYRDDDGTLYSLSVNDHTLM